MKRFKSVDEFMEAATAWQDELVRLRKILNSTELVETIKWGAPCYTYDGKNVVGLAAFKSFVALWFFQGALLSDQQGVLINAQEGKTKAMRQWRIGSQQEINSRLIKSYVKEAISLQAQGTVIKPDRARPLKIPQQLKSALAENKQAKTAFKALTKGKQREYATYIDEAKRDETKLKRIEKIIPMIIDGQGLHDKYRNC